METLEDREWGCHWGRACRGGLPWADWTTRMRTSQQPTVRDSTIFDCFQAKPFCSKQTSMHRRMEILVKTTNISALFLFSLISINSLLFLYIWNAYLGIPAEAEHGLVDHVLEDEVLVVVCCCQLDILVRENYYIIYYIIPLFWVALKYKSYVI